MKQICTQCGLSSQEGNLWCQRNECSTTHLNSIFPHGERLGDIEIKSLIRITRTAAFYEAQRGKEHILLKVAHEDTDDTLRSGRSGYAQRLKDEARYYQKLSEQNVIHPSLPVLHPPYRDSNIKKSPYGRIVFRDRLRYYMVFKHIQGQFLRDVLNNNPQPHFDHVAWLAINIAEAVSLMRVELKLQHLALSPDIIFVREDKDGIPRPVLLDLGLARPASGKQNMRLDADFMQWLNRFVHPAYMAPELIRGEYDPSTDVYGLGLLLYEMLAGRPAFEYKTKTETMILASVETVDRRPLNRYDLPDLSKIVENAVAERDRREGLNDIQAIAHQLMKLFGEVPVERVQRRWRNLSQQPILLIGGMLAILSLAILGILALLNVSI
jgi:serine/threonine protein kinase